MTHLTGDNIYELALLTEDCQLYSSSNLQQMEHLRVCKSCYEKFCSALAIINITSAGGYEILSGIYGIGADAEKVFVDKKILAAVQIVRERLEGSATAVIRQIEQAGALFQFTPVLATAARGVKRTDSEIFKAEDLDDEKTFIVFDAGRRELMIQLDRTKLGCMDVKVYLCFHNAEKTEVPMKEKGRYLRGIVGQIPDGDFQIQIEYVE